MADWQLSLALRGDLQKFLDADLRAGKTAVKSVIRRRTTGLKNNLRRQVKRAGLSDRLGKTIRGDTYPRRGASLNAAGKVFSKAVVKRNRGPVDLITNLDTGSFTIPGPGKKYLAIANPEVVQLGPGVKGRPRARSPSEFPPGTFVFRSTSKARLAVLVKKSEPTKVAFWLVKLVRQQKKIDIERAYQKAIRDIDGLIARTWERNDRKARNRFNVSN